jgi:hypothetical protein
MLLVAVLFGGAATAADCPGVRLSCGCAGDKWSNAPSYADTCTTETGGVTLRDYDLTAGHVHGAGLNGVSACLLTRDDFVIGGLPAGTPVHLTLSVDQTVQASAPSAGSTAGFILELFVDGVSTQILVDAYLNGGDPPINGSGVRTAGLDLVAGTPFQLSVDARCGGTGDGSGSISATYSFPDLPPGATLTSCSGYGTDVTAAHPTTWGQLKVRYR